MKIPPFSLFLVAAVSLQGATPEQIEFFESRIRPVLAQDCYECHSTATKKKGGLLLDTRAGWQEGGDSGPAIIPGDVVKSLLLQSIRHEHEDIAMPKNGAKLDDKVIADFEKWVAEGAFDPRDTPPSPDQVAKDTDWKAVLERRKKWWAFQPLKASLPKMKSGSENPVDAFVHAKLSQHGLPQAPPADNAILLRRLSYILTGLPPAPELLAAHQGASLTGDQTALSKLIDEFLASPRYGETWARHWLDWVRYAESYGSEGDPPIPYAWRYRDYVIRAFNENVPYPRMVREAIAGDLLSQPRINAQLGINESALGIGQLRMVLHGFSPTDSLDELVTFTDNQIDVVTKAFQGLTVSCARCHNHKFDAISQKDFYALYGIFTSTRPAVIDVNAADKGQAQRQQLQELKQKIKAIVGKAWLDCVPAAVSAARSSADAQATAPLLRWNPSISPIFTDGQGVKQGATKAGEFSIALEGKSTIARIYPSGVFSDLISTKDRGVLMSQRIKCEGGTLWIRCAGEGGARAKYVVQNFPRTGTIHKALELKAGDDAKLGWRSLDLDYWKGDDIFIQITTASDLPAENRPEGRSWFAVTDTVITKDKIAPAPPPMSADLRRSIESWLNNTLTDDQAELLNTKLKAGELPNDIADAAPLVAQYREIEAALPMPTRAPGVLEADAHDAALFVRGDHKQPSETVPRRFLEAIDPAPFQAKASGRLELAERFADLKSNPLAARVIVNRLWHHVFGRGIVATPDNFGKLGEPPSHPELLDYLAQRFIDEGGSIKAMLKLLMSSKTFLAADAAPSGAAAKDSENKLLSHWTVRRLAAEPIRDSLIALTGNLDGNLYGEPGNDDDPRRSIYLKVIRNNMDDFLTSFDMPVPMSTRGKRDVTNVPAQSLALLNDRNVIQWSALWARRAAQMHPEPEQRVQQMFIEALGREPSAKELAASISFVQDSANAAIGQKTELASIKLQEQVLQAKIDAVLAPQRAKLSANRPDKAVAKAPIPYAEWDFEKDARDNQGNLHLTLEGGARIENGALVLDGRTSLARSELLPKDLKAKTLEAWVQLDTLDQRGGGVMTVQDKKGVVFDSIVFGEKRPREWLGGSDHHQRTKDLKGVIESDADKRPVHIAISFGNGKVVAYRDGVLYGKGYKVDESAEFSADNAMVLFGCRHGGAGGTKMLRGRILRARLYDRELRPPDIEASRGLEASAITDRDVLDALDNDQRNSVREWQTERERLSMKASTLQDRLKRLNPNTAGWESLALSLINLKEFIYLR